ncbi:beta-2-microglobulin-like [Mastacembelus armatus]|uniref:Beta-2-microglobulin n=1 Tax=Mastacembelus armatus TaxID=205130 RepID=A0A3Q3NM53_9TELE|nr:beta-2-microglobulin-like [Mastacembelus armatus]
MKLLCAVLVGLLGLLGLSMAKDSPPMVQVYTRTPGEYGKSNTFICHVSGFHPPEITIDLLKNGVVVPEAKQTDLAFEENWFYYLTKHTVLTPNKGDVISCRVTHLGKTNSYNWESDM